MIGILGKWLLLRMSLFIITQYHWEILFRHDKLLLAPMLLSILIFHFETLPIYSLNPNFFPNLNILPPPLSLSLSPTFIYHDWVQKFLNFTPSPVPLSVHFHRHPQPRRHSPPPSPAFASSPNSLFLSVTDHRDKKNSNLQKKCIKD